MYHTPPLTSSCFLFALESSCQADAVSLRDTQDMKLAQSLGAAGGTNTMINTDTEELLIDGLDLGSLLDGMAIEVRDIGTVQKPPCAPQSSGSGNTGDRELNDGVRSTPVTPATIARMAQAQPVPSCQSGSDTRPAPTEQTQATQFNAVTHNKEWKRFIRSSEMRRGSEFPATLATEMSSTRARLNLFQYLKNGENWGTTAAAFQRIASRRNTAAELWGYKTLTELYKLYPESKHE
jgi:hypothetical protein